MRNKSSFVIVGLALSIAGGSNLAWGAQDKTAAAPIQASTTKQMSYTNPRTGKTFTLPMTLQPGNSNMVTVTCGNGETKSYPHNTCSNIDGALTAGYCDTRGGNKSAACDYLR